MTPFLYRCPNSDYHVQGFVPKTFLTILKIARRSLALPASGSPCEARCLGLRRNRLSGLLTIR